MVIHLITMEWIGWAFSLLGAIPFVVLGWIVLYRCPSDRGWGSSASSSLTGPVEKGIGGGMQGPRDPSSSLGSARLRYGRTRAADS